MHKAIIFTRHAEFKLLLLERHGFKISRKEVEETVKIPERVQTGYKGRKIAERILTKNHLLRVVFEEFAHELKVVTLYPARRDRYAD